MDRRKFLKKVGFVGATVVVAPTVLAETPEVWSDTVTIGQPFVKAGTIDFTDNLIVQEACNVTPWEFDKDTQNIIYKGGWDDNGVKLKDLYKFLKDEWRSEEIKPFKPPVIREFGSEYGEFKSFKI